jgi:hypothetical protein
MNTSTRASFKDANHAHASTARGPLLRPEGVILPNTTTTTSQPATLQAQELEKAHQAQITYTRTASTDAHCATLAACYREALNNEEAQLPVTHALLTSARYWLYEQYYLVLNKGYCPVFLPGPQPLESALIAFSQPSPYPYTIRAVPVSTDNNGSHPVWTPFENLLFRFVHDYAHFTIGAPATFDGELAVARHTLTPAVRADEPLARFLASESVGQVALSIVTGTYPEQIIAAGILELI